MNFTRYLLFFILLFFGGGGLVSAQVYVRVTQTSGTQTFSDQNVTITSAGSATPTGMWGDCDANPYWIGANYSSVVGSYTFAFSIPVTRIKVHVSAVNIGEVNSFYVNGVHFPISPADLDSLKTCDTTYYHQVSTNLAGNVIYTGPMVGNSSYFGRFGAGIVNIYYPGGIDSIRVQNNGIEGGTSFGLFYYGFFAAAYNDSACYGDTLKLFSLPDIAGPPDPVFTWSGPNGFVSNEQNPMISNSSSIHEGKYIVHIKYGVFEATDTTEVKLRKVPAAPSITAQSPGCQGSTVRMNGSSSDAGVDFKWSGPNNYDNTQATGNIRNFQPRDTGYYTLITTLNGCPSLPSTVHMGIAYPTDGDTVENAICRGGSYDFYGKKITQEGVYSHTLEGANSNGCDSTTYMRLIIQLGIDTISESICQGSAYWLGNQAYDKEGIYQNTFKTAGGCDSVVVLLLSIIPPPVDTLQEVICSGSEYIFNGKTLTNPGWYMDTVQTSEGCDSVIVLHLAKHPIPELSLDYDANRRFCLGDTVIMTAQGAESYSWTVNEQDLGTENPMAVVLNKRETQIFVRGADMYNCSDSLFLAIQPNACCELFIPNTFSPNGDGNNDQFQVKPLGHLQSFQINIFNRWGELIFTSDHINKTWDGTYNGAISEVGTYFYHILSTCSFGNLTHHKGDILLVR